MSTLYLDLETYSPVSLDCGVYAYAEQADILLVQWAVNDQPVQVYEAGPRVMQALAEWIETVDTVVAHNIEFETVLLRRCARIEIPLAKRYCTMGQARRHGLPGGLAKLSEVFGLPQSQAKDKSGKRLIKVFCIPQKDGARFDKTTHPEEWEAFKAYAASDVEAMRVLHGKMPKWNDEVERPIWELDQIVNERGFAVDIAFASAAVRELKASGAALDERMDNATLGQVERGTQRDRLLRFLLREYEVSLPDMTQPTLERRLKDDALPDAVRELLAVRLESSKTSTSKYATLLRCASEDQRLRGTLVYCGATRTGRWAGAKFQPHNLPRPDMDYEEIEYGIDEILASSVGLTTGESATRIAANAIRGAVVAAPDHRLGVADLSNIEGRVVAWLAGEGWKIDAFLDYDRGTGPDLYRLAYARAFALPISEVTGKQRSVGKVMELMLGYGGGVGAFITGAETYRVDLEDMAAHAWPAIPRDIQIEAEKAYFWAVSEERDFDLSRAVYCACDALKRLWRREHPAIEDLWHRVEDAAKWAAEGKGATQIGLLHFDRQDNWLRMRLPSGRYLCYPSPRVQEGKLTFMGQDQYTKSWRRMKTWGGTLVENACQAVARDVLRDGMLTAESAHMPIVLHVHDEIVCEISDDRTAEDLEWAMTAGREWCAGLPLAAKAFETHRYRKAD